MSIADLIRRATESGVNISLDRGSLKLRAECPPPSELLAELAANKVALIQALTTKNPQLESAWLWLVVLVDEVIQSTYTPVAGRDLIEKSARERYGGRFVRAVPVPITEQLLSRAEIRQALSG